MASTVWKGHIAFGLVSFPVKLYAAARSKTVSFHLLHKCNNSRVKQVLYCQAENQPVPRADLVKGFEYEKDRYVVLDKHDLRRAEPASARVMEVLQFVPAAQVDAVYLDRSYYVVPDAAGQRPYKVLFQALQQTAYAAVAQWTVQHREHMVLLRPGRRGLILHTLYYQDEVRAEEEFHTESTPVAARELELARLLIEALAAAFHPHEYRDRYRENLRALIDAKIQEQQTAQGTPALVRPPVADILDALKHSIALAKKSAAETEVCRSPRRKRA